MSKTKISPRGSAWDKFEKQLFTPEEIEASNMRISSISRIEKGTNGPQLTPVGDKTGHVFVNVISYNNHTKEG